MTPTRWLFEHEALVRYEKAKFKVYFESGFEAFRDTLIGLLGCNMVPPTQDPETGEYKESGVRWVPLAAYINPALYGEIAGKLAEIHSPEPPPSSEEYEQQVAQFDDLVPMFDEIFEGAEQKIYDAKIEEAMRAGVLGQKPTETPEDLEKQTPNSDEPRVTPKAKRRVQLE